MLCNKTPRLDDIAGEAAAFHETLHELGQWPGGAHLELAGEDVTGVPWRLARAL